MSKHHGNNSGGVGPGGGGGGNGGGGNSGGHKGLPKHLRHLIHSIYQEPNTPLPALAADPNIDAQRRAAQRGLEDLLVKLHRQGHQARQDAHTTIQDTRVQARRSKHDIQRGRRRDILSIQQHRQDTRRSLTRGEQDFHTKLASLVQNFGNQASAQGQAANAAGVYDAGTLAASSAARATNFARERQPLDIARQRLQQDTRTNLGRLGIQARQTRTDAAQNLLRLGQDTQHDIHLTRRDLGRQIQDFRTQRQIGIREQRIGNADYLNSEIYSARQNYPGAFNRQGRRTGKPLPGF